MNHAPIFIVKKSITYKLCTLYTSLIVWTVRPIKYALHICTFSCSTHEYGSLKIHMMYLPIFFRVASLALGQSYDCPSASEATLQDMGLLSSTKPQHEHNSRETHYSAYHDLFCKCIIVIWFVILFQLHNSLWYHWIYSTLHPWGHGDSAVINNI